MPISPAARLLLWYKHHGRNLPWRKTRNPYCILVSEIMLQQTQVDRVKIFYGKWLKQFPNWKQLAEATNADVIHTWSGLGYNRRALVLRDIARHVRTHGIPQSEPDWLNIKGIGPYTAAAVSAFAQQKRTLPIDTNIRRVLGRFLLGKPFPHPKDDKTIRIAAGTFLPQRGAFYDVPQALFDLATTVCTKNPRCRACPMRHDCPSVKQFLNNHAKIPKRSVVVPKEKRHRNKPYPDRIYRGRILRLIHEQKEVHFMHIGTRIDQDFEKEKDQLWIQTMIQKMVTDGLLSQRNDVITLSDK